MAEKYNVPEELQYSFPSDGINFQDISFLISKNIYNAANFTNKSFSEYKAKKCDKSEKEVIHYYYSKHLKTLKQVLRAFDVERYFLKNSGVGEEYRFSRSEALFYYTLFYRMEEHYKIWSKIRNVKNETYQGFIEIYYKCADKKEFVAELDFFIKGAVELYLSALKEEKEASEANQVASILEEHLLFTTQRLTINMIEQITCIHFNPNVKKNTMSIKRWIDYKRYLKQLYYCGGKVIDDINDEFLSENSTSEHKNHFNLTTDSYKYYLIYEDNYQDKVSKISETLEISELSEMSETENLPEQKKEKENILNIKSEEIYSEDSSESNDEMNGFLGKLLDLLKKYKPKKYSKVTLKDIYNPYTSEEATSLEVLPESFPSDIMVVCLYLDEIERNAIFYYYNDYPDLI